MSKFKIPKTPHDLFAGTNKDSAIFGIAVALAIYGKFTENLKPLFYFSAGVTIMFIFYVANRILGKQAENP